MAVLWLAIMLFPAKAAAATGTGSLTVVVNAPSSITVTIPSIGGSPTGLGTSAVTTALGERCASCVVPANFTKYVFASSWTLSSSIGVRVDKSSLTSANYTLTARLSTTPLSGMTWKVNYVTLSTTNATITTTGAYATTVVRPWDLEILNSMAPASYNNQIIFTATSN